MDATNLTLHPNPGAHYMGTTAFTKVNRYLTTFDPAFVDFSATRIPWNAYLAHYKATELPLPFLLTISPLRKIIPIDAPPFPGVLSVLSVLKIIHECLHREAPHDVLRLPRYAGATRQFFIRLMSIQDLEERWAQLQQGVKFVDLLRGTHVFAGLVTPTHNWPGWEVLLSRT